MHTVRTLTRLLIANRGEIAIRIARSAADLGITPVAVYPDDDAASLHRHACPVAIRLDGRGAAAYLDGEALIRVAKAHDCEAIHPGYGFLSENAAFARRCAEEGLLFIGPSPETLAMLGDKARARELARSLQVPLVPGTFAASSLDEVRAFVAELRPGEAAMIKAIAGGGGRGMRSVRSVDEVDAAYERCRSEARGAFGNGDLYVERLVRRARHVEVQVLGDGERVAHAFERDCTLQRRNQKLIEIAPAPGLDPALRKRILAAATRIAQHVNYRGLGTFEFLVDLDAPREAPAFYFMEANPRLQVEHTITEEITGLDLVATQIELVRGRRLHELGLAEPLPAPRCQAIQLRINMETLTDNGDARPEGGLITRYEIPSGPGIRADGYGYGGYRTSPAFDSMLAKLIVRAHGLELPALVQRARRALRDVRIEGVRTNLDVLDALLGMPATSAYDVDTRFVQTHLAEILDHAQQADWVWRPHGGGAADAAGSTAFSSQGGAPASGAATAPAGTVAMPAPLQGTVLSINAEPGGIVRKGQQIAVLEAMKMEHIVAADVSGIVRAVPAEVGATLYAGDPLLFVEPGDHEGEADVEQQAERDLDQIRPDLAAVRERQRRNLDESRPAAIARRRARNQRTARENIADLCDPGSFAEYGMLALAAQRQRRTYEQLIDMSPADGLVSGTGTINAALFGPDRTRCLILAYDFTVFAGTQGWMNHKKKDRLLDLARKWRWPVVLYGEGGGGRPGETDGLSIHGLETPSFARFASLSGVVPLVAVVSGRCFAGNAALVGCCDVIIATRDANLGMSGPAMIEGGGLGVYQPEDIGPASLQAANGVVDLVVDDEAAATAATRRYLSYFQGALPDWRCADQRELRWSIPENRRRGYDIRALIRTLVDEDSVFELKAEYGPGMVTALVRIEGRPMGLIANNPMHLGGAVDAPGADKASRFMRLCNDFGLPLLSLCDTPGFMVGPQAEQDGQVRYSAQMFLAAAKLHVPVFTIVLRKGYGLGAQSMAAGSFHAPLFIVSWPTGEFGGMGIEGAVRLGYRRELEAIEDPQARERFFDERVAHLYDVGKAVNMEAAMEIDAVIDPAETRTWIRHGLQAAAMRDAAPPR